MADDFDFDAAYAAAQAGQSGNALFDLSHDGLALGMGRQWPADARHVALWSKWLFWTGARWEPDERLIHMTRCRDYLRRRSDDLVRNATKIWPDLSPDKARAQAEGIAKGLRSEPMRANVCSMARSNAELVATVAQWDAGLSLLGTPGGTIDLRTGDLREARPSEFITKLTSVAPAPPGSPAPIWQAFLERIFRHDLELVPFIQRATGYSLLGEIRDYVVLFCWGQGGNGKGVLLNTVSHVLGEYAAVGGAGSAARDQFRPAPVRHGDAARRPHGHLPGAWPEPRLGRAEAQAAHGRRSGCSPVHAAGLLHLPVAIHPVGRWQPQAIVPRRRRSDQAPRSARAIPAGDSRSRARCRVAREAACRTLSHPSVDDRRLPRLSARRPQAACKRASGNQELPRRRGHPRPMAKERCVVHPRIGWTALKTLYADWTAWAAERGHRTGTDKHLSKRLDERGFERCRGGTGAYGFRGVGLMSPHSSEDTEPSPDITRMGARAGTDGVHYGGHVQEVQNDPDAWPEPDADGWEIHE
jgi:D5 N terminal like